MVSNKQKPGQAKRGPKPKAPEEKREKKSYYATPTEHTQLKDCLRAMRETGKDKEP